MKKSIILLALILGVGGATANAQEVIEGTKFGDNWAIGINGGVITPTTHHAFFKNMRPAFGLEVSKQLTPIFGIGLQGMGYVNTTKSKTAIDGSDVSALAKINLMNLFAGYNGTPRLFEIETVTGIGWLHSYVNGDGDMNSWSTRFGFNFNFNLGEEKAWTVALKPAIVYDMSGDFDQSTSGFNVNRSGIEITAGVTYHFKCSTGNHYFTKVRAYDQGQIDDLNASINSLRSDVSNKNNDLNNANRKIAALQKDLDACNSRVVPVDTVVSTARIPESIITFRQGKSVVDASQLPNVERVATYMKNHKDSKVVIKGYASPEGSAAFNAKIATARAEAVRTILINRYKIASSRISAEGQGVGDMFSEPDWNRVSICTIDD